MPSVPASTSAASSSTSDEVSAAVHTLEELEAVLAELDKMLAGFSESTTELVVLNWWVSAVRALLELDSLMDAQRHRVEVMLNHYDYYQPGGGGRLAPVSFEEMVSGERGEGNRFVETFRFTPEQVEELAEKLHLPKIIYRDKKAPIDRDLALLILLYFLAGPQRQIGHMEHHFQRDHRDINE